MKQTKDAALLGVTALEPGFACVRVAPSLSDGEAVAGTVIIPDGIVDVRWVNDDQQFTLVVSAPTGVHLQVRLPAGVYDDLFVDGEPIAVDTQTIRSSDYVELAVLPGSTYSFLVIKN